MKFLLSLAVSNIITRKSTSHLLILLQNVTNAHNSVDCGTAWSKNFNSGWIFISKSLDEISDVQGMRNIHLRSHPSFYC